MQAEELDQMLHRKPFQPFRIVLKDGRSYDIRYQHLAAVRDTFMSVGTPVPGQDDPFFDHIYHLDLADIIRVVPLDRPTAAGTK